jgi:mycoredoxin
MYSTSWCVDCRRAKKFLTDRGVRFVEVNIDEEPDAEELVLQVNEGPFDPCQLFSELNIPLNR